LYSSVFFINVSPLRGFSHSEMLLLKLCETLCVLCATPCPGYAFDFCFSSVSLLLNSEFCVLNSVSQNSQYHSFSFIFTSLIVNN
jgi:hypothetical protein